jgi:hypothetical protein
MVSNRVEMKQDETAASRSRKRYRSRRIAQQNKSIPLLTRLILPFGPVSSRGISRASCCTFRSRAQPIFGDYSVSHPVSNLFSSRPASSKHTKREEEIPLQGTGLAKHSHPITTSNGTVGIGSVNATAGTTLDHLVAGSGNSIRLVGIGGMLGGWSTCGRSIGTGTTWLLLLVLGWLLTCGLGNGLGILLVLVDSPVKDIVILEALTNEEITEDLSEVGVIRLVVETKRTSVVEVDGELVGEATAEDLSWGGHLLLHDSVILLLLGGSLQSLPRKGATAEVEHNVTKRLHVITTRLLYKDC